MSLNVSVELKSSHMSFLMPHIYKDNFLPYIVYSIYLWTGYEGDSIEFMVSLDLNYDP